MQRKTKASIAILILSIVALAITTSFLFVNLASPLGKWIYIHFACSNNGHDIVGLPVTVGTETVKTNATGWAGPFGSGFAPGTYTYTFEWWNGTSSGTVTIDCSKRDWFFYVQLVNPEVHKTFRVGSAYEDYPPIQRFAVTLKGVALTETQFGTTNADGYVEFILDYPFHDYTLEWTWNGVKHSEPVSWAAFENGVWSKTNYLEPKSGGGK